MSIRKFLPYHVKIERSANPLYTLEQFSRRLQWIIGVHDRQYNVIFATWLERKPTKAQIAKISVHGDEDAAWNNEGVQCWLYNDGCIPDSSAVHWRSYSERLYWLAKMPCVYEFDWGPKVFTEVLPLQAARFSGLGDGSFAPSDVARFAALAELGRRGELSSAQQQVLRELRRGGAVPPASAFTKPETISIDELKRMARFE